MCVGVYNITFIYIQHAYIHSPTYIHTYIYTYAQTIRNELVFMINIIIIGILCGYYAHVHAKGTVPFFSPYTFFSMQSLHARSIFFCSFACILPWLHVAHTISPHIRQ